MKFKQWLLVKESSARQRAAMNPGIPAQADLVFSKTPYSVKAFCDKVKSPGVKTFNINKDSICKK